MLRIGDIDYGRGMVRVSPENSKTIERHVPIPTQFLKVIRDEYKLHTYSRAMYVFGKAGMPGMQHIGKNNLRFRFAKIRKKLNMPEMYKLYSWKHTGNVCSDLAGITLRDLQHHNGHTSILTTEKYLKNMRGIISENIVQRFPSL